MKRFAIANWQGTGKTGKGQITSQSGVLNKTPFSFINRFEHGTGTDSEELIAAAHACCFTMMLSFLLTEAGYIPENIYSHCEITIEARGRIAISHLTVTVQAPGINKEKFDDLINIAKRNCRVSKLFNASITCDAKLNC